MSNIPPINDAVSNRRPYTGALVGFGVGIIGMEDDVITDFDGEGLGFLDVALEVEWAGVEITNDVATSDVSMTTDVTTGRFDVGLLEDGADAVADVDCKTEKQINWKICFKSDNERLVS